MATQVDPVGTEPTVARPIQAVQTSAALKHGTSRPELTRIADSLEDEYQIGHVRDHPRLHRRYVILRSPQIFERLTVLYRRQFNANWQLFRRTVEAFELPQNVQDPLLYAARCYVSGWFWDLYVSNRKCVEKLTHTALAQHYNTQTFHSCDRYDPFLQHLNSIIRPTHIQNALEDTLYLPLINQQINFNAPNPFDINDFTMNEALVQGIQDVMDQKSNNWNLLPLSDNTMGRPMWLLDWRSNQAYAWFPSEANYSREDLVAAQILGIPCSPRLGPRDFDDWQIFPGGTLPANINFAAFQRITPRHFYGAAEYRTVSTGQWTIPIQTGTTTRTVTEEEPPPKRTRTEGQTGEGESGSLALPSSESGSSQAQTRTIQIPTYTTVYRYQIIDWTYHARVVIGINEQKQNQAIRSFLFPKN